MQMSAIYKIMLMFTAERRGKEAEPKPQSPTPFSTETSNIQNPNKTFSGDSKLGVLLHVP